ncbi:MAG: ribonuclease P protein component [Clostridiales Family XIII bacterium]|jgi:ribonuclease P protein component|nr:ribonuclease P protein component [Clostridiales Family XIII bacterium]
MLKKEILRNKRDFDRLFKKGKSAGGKYLVLFFVRNGFEYNRRAFLASKKVGNSVQRNRARRLIRESFRVVEGGLKPGFDILFIARNTMTETRAKQKDIEKNMKQLLTKSGLLL